MSTQIKIKESVTGKKLSALLMAKIGLNKEYRKEIGGFNFILSMIKKYGQPYLALLNERYLLNITMESIQSLKAADLSKYMNDKERERFNVTNTFTMWAIATLIGRHFKELKETAKAAAAAASIVKVAAPMPKAAKAKAAPKAPKAKAAK